MKIAIIGAGNMGGAIARALAQSDFAQNNSIYISNRSKAKLDILKESFPQLYTTTDNSEAASCADIVIIAVKPWILDSVAHEIASCVKQENCMIISVVAAIPFSHYDELFCGYHPTFRVIPNTAAVVGEGISVIAANHATQAQTELVQSISTAWALPYSPTKTTSMPTWYSVQAGQLLPCDTYVPLWKQVLPWAYLPPKHPDWLHIPCEEPLNSSFLTESILKPR